LHVPPLRERGDDIPLLFDHFARRCASSGRRPVRAAPDLKQWMLDHHWPGNCRELLNFVERLSVLWPGEEMSLASIPTTMLPRRPDSPAPSAEEHRAVLEMWERDIDETPAEASAWEGEAVASWSVEPPGLPCLPGASGAVASVDLKKLLAEYEEAWIRASLRETQGNITHSADLLGLPRTTFIERLRKYGLSASRQ
jgi:sigma-54 specific flagellar transcriptional regulator A